MGAGALREHAKRIEKNTAKTSLSKPTQKCPANPRLKVRASGRDRYTEALLPGKGDTEKALGREDVVMKGKKDMGVGDGWTGWGSVGKVRPTVYVK